MKKILTLILAGFMLLSLCSCNIVNMKGDEVELNYDTAKMEANMNEIKQDGLYVELMVTSYESGDKPETSRMAYAETEDMFYFVGDGMETYYDFSDDAKTVMFDKNEEGVWVRSEIIYAETGMTREQMKANCELQASAIFNYLGSYEQFNGQKMKKTTTTVAGRECDEFNISVGFMGYGMNYIFAVDPETGMCLKWSVSASAGIEGSASVSFTCNKFETPYTITLPTDYIEDGAAEGNEGTSGDEGGTQGGSVSGNIKITDMIAGSTSVIYGQLPEAEKQAIIAEAQKEGVGVSFGADGSMTVVDTDGSVSVQHPDGTWTFTDANGNEASLGTDWSSNEYASLLPEPTVGTISSIATEGTTCTVLISWTVEEAKAYATTVKGTGFNLNVEEIDIMGIYNFSATNADGVTVTVMYTGDIGCIMIEVQ